MISRISGKLASVADGKALLTCGHFTYEILLTTADAENLIGRQGDETELFTLHFLEAQSQGSSFVPRLVGFVEAQDRSFFELFTTVKGVGTRKALRALTVPVQQVAQAIARKDHEFLITLPEIGKRTAESIVAELHDRVTAHLGTELDDGASTESAAASDAITMLCQLGETRPTARRLITLAIKSDPTLATPEQLVAAACQQKEGA